MNSPSKRLSYGLLAISSVLLSIWAANNTIALRNILLVIGAVLSIFYLNQQRITGLISRLRLIDLLPIIFICAMFAWVLVHSLLISSESSLQWQEVKSTWLRSFGGVLLGLATGLAMHHMKRLLPWLWVGSLFSFLYLISQYIPRAQELDSIFAVDWSGYYIFSGKINCVLIGSILVAGLVGAWVDQFRWDNRRSNIFLSLYCVFGIILVLYAYVFLFDTRNGLGVTFLLVATWIAVAVLWGAIQIFSGASIKISKTILVPIVLVILGLLWFASQQIQRNSGWTTMAEDVYIAAQVDKYPNWQNVAKFGVPRTDNDRAVAGNTYERVSWAIIGLQLVPKQPWGNGVLAGSFKRALQGSYPDASPFSTHSAWIEIALAYGFPGIIFSAGTLMLIFFLTMTSPTGCFNASIHSLGFVLLILYSIGELSTQHGIEILFYLMAFLATLRLPIKDRLVSKDLN